MNQNINHVFKAEDLDWKQLETIGIDKQQLEEDGNLELLLQGEETEPVSLKIRTAVLSMTTDAKLKLAGEMQFIFQDPYASLMEINGLRADETM